MSSPEDDKPSSDKNSFFSSCSIPASSSSILAHITNTFELSFSASLRIEATWTLDAASFAKSSSATLAAYITGLFVRRLQEFIISSSSISSVLKALAEIPDSNKFLICFNSSLSFDNILSERIPFSALEIRFSTISRSENISSRFIVSISRTGFTVPSTWVTFESSKHLTTCTIASTSRICDKNLFPSPSPLLAPLTNPAMSTNSIIAGNFF